MEHEVPFTSAVFCGNSFVSFWFKPSIAGNRHLLLFPFHVILRVVKIPALFARIRSVSSDFTVSGWSRPSKHLHRFCFVSVGCSILVASSHSCVNLLFTSRFFLFSFIIFVAFF